MHGTSNLPTFNVSHPMLPYVAQGAAQAVEDAAVLGLVLSKITSKDEIPTALKAYELARKIRSEKVQSTAGHTRTVLHMMDGDEQMKRDQAFANIAVGGENPDPWGDPAAQKFLWSFDVEQDFIDNFDCISFLVVADSSIHGGSKDWQTGQKPGEEI
jgi:salicylate hydroxylase